MSVREWLLRPERRVPSTLWKVKILGIESAPQIAQTGWTLHCESRLTYIEVISGPMTRDVPQTKLLTRSIIFAR